MTIINLSFYCLLSGLGLEVRNGIFLMESFGIDRLVGKLRGGMTDF